MGNSPFQLLAPPAEFITAVQWLGVTNDDGTTTPAGSGVVVHVDNREYLATALHVAKYCDYRPAIRRYGHWWRVNWTFVGSDKDGDIAVLKTDDGTLSPLTPRYGLGNVIIGGIGRAMGFPAPPFDQVAMANEMLEHPVPISVPVCAYMSGLADIHMVGGYLNNGFSGGAVVFPTDTGWTIAGIITHSDATLSPVYAKGTGERIPIQGAWVEEPSGLFQFTRYLAVERLITAADSKKPG